MLHWWNDVLFRQFQCLAWTLLASLQSEELVECSQHCRTIHIFSRYGNVCVVSVMNAGAFSLILFQVVLLIYREGEKCVWEALDCWINWRKWKSYFVQLGWRLWFCLPQILPLLFFVPWVLNDPFPTLSPVNKMTIQQGRSWSWELFF